MKIFDTPPKPGMPVRHKMFFNAFLRMARAWEKLKVHNGHVDWSNGMPTIVVDLAGEAELDLSKAAFGYKINPAGNDPDLIRIYAGEAYRIVVAQTDLTVANNDYVWIRHRLTNNTIDGIFGGANVPGSDASFAYYRLYRFEVTNGTATIKNIYHPFDIEGESSVFTSTGMRTITQVRQDSGTGVVSYKFRVSVFANGIMITLGDESDWVNA